MWRENIGAWSAANGSAMCTASYQNKRIIMARKHRHICSLSCSFFKQRACKIAARRRVTAYRRGWRQTIWHGVWRGAQRNGSFVSVTSVMRNGIVGENDNYRLMTASIASGVQW